MRGTRRQDFSLALYGLQTAFDSLFLRLAPIQAARAAIESVNAEVPRTHRRSDGEQEFTFRFGDSDARFLSDYSEIWDRSGNDDLSLSILDAALDHAAQLMATDGSHDAGVVMVRAIAERSRYGVVWRRILQAFRRHSAELYPVLGELLRVPELLAAPETTIEAGEVLKLISDPRLISDADLVAIERALFCIEDSRFIKRYEKPESIRNRLLLCVPASRLQLPESKELVRTLLETDSARANEPYHKTNFAVLSAEEALRYQGIEPADPANAAILQALAPLEAFEQKHVNSVPALDECDAIAPALAHLNDFVTTQQVPERLVERARGVLCATAEVVVKNVNLPKSAPLWSQCRGILLEGGRDPLPKFDPEHHLKFDRPAWGGPAPRIEAAQGLIHVLWNWGRDAGVEAAIRILGDDPVPAVRFQVANGLSAFYRHDAKDEFWTVLEGMVTREQTSGVMLGLVSTLGRVANPEPAKVVELLSVVINRGFVLAGETELADHLLAILMWLGISQQNQRANEVLSRFEEDAAKYDGVLKREVLAAFRYFRFENAEQRSEFRRARALVIRAAKRSVPCPGCTPC